MTETKEKILYTALELFAQRGYDAVSVSDIAGRLGITKGALYRHYKSKRDIFDTIILCMEENDTDTAVMYDMPESKLEECGDKYDSVTLRQLSEFTRNRFRYWTEDKFASDFRHMLEIERHNNHAISELYHMYLGKGPLEYVADIMKFVAPGKDSNLLAVRYYAPMYLLMDIDDKEEAFRLLENHLQSFEKDLL